MTEIRRILETEANALLNVPVDQPFTKASELIHAHVHKKGGRVIVSGMGKAGQVANNLATTFSSTGTPAVFLHPSEAQHGDLGVMRENDILIVFSNSGMTREILELEFLAHQLYESIPVILITGNPEGELVDKADITLLTGSPQEVCPLGLTPTTSTTVMTVIGDVLTVLLMNKIKFKPLDYARRHHGGYLGQKSRKDTE